MQRMPSLLFAIVLSLAGCRENSTQSVSAALEISPQRLEFGRVAVGFERRATLTLSNPSPMTVTVAPLNLQGPFSLAAGDDESIEIAAGMFREIEIVFAPIEAGLYEVNLTLEASTVPSEHPLVLAGEAVEMSLKAGRTDLDFGDVRVGAYKTLGLTLVNTSLADGRTTVRIIGADAAQFKAPWNASEIIPANGTASLSVTFRPSQAGAHRASLLFRPCPSCAEAEVPLTGHGIESCLTVLPDAIDFGAVMVGGGAVRTLSVAVAAREAMEIGSIALVPSSSDAFALDPSTQATPFWLQPGETATLSATFRPQAEGPLEASLRIEAAGASDACWVEIPMTGLGGESCIVAEPRRIDFGTVALGASARRTVLVKNLDCGGPIWVEDFTLGAPSAMTAGPERPLPVMLVQGESLEFNLLFAPGEEGGYAGALKVGVAGEFHEPVLDTPGDIVVTGDAREIPPCELSLTPPRLDFGIVAPGGRAALGQAIENTGPDLCFISGLGLSSNTDPAFSLSLVGGEDSEATGEFVLQPGESRLLEVDFAPTTDGLHQGAVEFYRSNPEDAFVSSPLLGDAESGCVSVTPQLVDFGAAVEGCPAPQRAVHIANVCAGGATLDSLLRAPSSSAAIQLVSPPAFPMTLPGNASFDLTFRYSPTAATVDLAAWSIGTNGAFIALSERGEGLAPSSRVDRFTQTRATQVDVLFVLDNSGSMTAKQKAVGDNLVAFLSVVSQLRSDFHLAVTTTGIESATGSWAQCPGGVDGGEAGRLFPADGSSTRIFAPTTPDLEAQWAIATHVGICHWSEQGLEAAVRALTPPLADSADDPRTALPNDGNLGFLRPDAKLAVVFVSDEEDQSPDALESYFSRLMALKPDPSMISLSAIVGPQPLCAEAITTGARYTDLAQRTGGVVESICSEDWAASLERIGRTAFGASSAFQLQRKPADPSRIAVTVDGHPASGWVYVAPTRSVVFVPGAVPPEGAVIEIAYTVACDG